MGLCCAAEELTLIFGYFSRSIVVGFWRLRKKYCRKVQRRLCGLRRRHVRFDINPTDKIRRSFQLKIARDRRFCKRYSIGFSLYNFFFSCIEIDVSIWMFFCFLLVLCKLDFYEYVMDAL